MSNRFKDAQCAQSGACNPRPISAALVNAINDCYTEGVSPTKDPAVFLILHQLVWILAGHDFGLNEGMAERWGKDTKFVESMVEGRS